MKKIITASFLSTLILLGGCASTDIYEPQGLTAKNMAFLKADSEHAHGIFVGLDERLYINTINGQAAGDFFKGYPEQAKIIAGFNEVKVDYYQGQLSSEGCVRFNAEPGETYIIRKKREGMSVYYWVEQEGTATSISQGCSA
ncbi:hypothetical protein [Thalassotalea aquiviva]|uniref:hypothetical protein n=1 Tax=Thalassotalea aquiviva TaxID=3242415 RepID=UPI00352B2CF8